MEDVIENFISSAEEPSFFEHTISGIKAWQIIFLGTAVLSATVIAICCCFRFRVPRTKQQIEADYQRRQLTKKFHTQLKKIEDAKIDSMDFKDALEVLHNEISGSVDSEHRTGSQVSSLLSRNQSLDENGCKSESRIYPESQHSAADFLKLANKVNQIAKFSRPFNQSTSVTTNPKVNV